MKSKVIAMIITIILCIIFIIGVRSTVFGSQVIDKEKYKEYKIISETKYLELYYSYENHSIMVHDKRSGDIWFSMANQEKHGTENINAFTRTSMQSLFSFTYNDFKNESKESSKLSNSVLEESEVSEKDIENGISISYNFTKLGINATVDIWIDDNSLYAKVPVEKIKETGKYGLMNIELMPFFGAADDNENGYIFYPDGCGAIMHFGENPNIYANKYRWFVYGTDKVDIDSYEAYEQKKQEQAMLPVFGMIIGNSGYLAIIEDGACDTAINLCPSGHIVNLNRIYPEFTYRRSFKDPRPNVENASKVEKEIIKADHSVRYIFLNHDEAGYSGMANVYRNYLIESNGIKRNISVQEDIPLALELFMGIKERNLLFDRYIAMTTFDQAQEILDTFKNQGIDRIQVSLKGWTKNGYGILNAHLPPNRLLGGSSGLKRLVEYTSENDIQLLLQDNFFNLQKGAGTFVGRYDIAYQMYKMVVTDRKKEYFLYNPVNAFEKFRNYLFDINKYRINGLQLEKVGQLLYYDYNIKYPVIRQNTADYWCKMIEESSNKLGFTAVHGGNAYILPYANRLCNIPVEDTGYFITSEQVPFYQMVVHGLIPYTSSNPANLFYDYPREKLKWVEYGCMPYFELTYNEAELLRYTDYNKNFSSCYEDWVKTAVDIYKEFNERLGDIWSKNIIEHKKLNQGLYSITYEDGSVVYVNYNEQEASINEHKIKALDYLVVDRRGEER